LGAKTDRESQHKQSSNEDSSSTLAGLSAFCKWLLVGICGAWIFAMVPPAVRVIPAFLMLLWALAAPFISSWACVDISGWAFHQGYYGLAQKVSVAAVRLDLFLQPLVSLFGLSDSPFAVFNSLNLANVEMVNGQFVRAQERLAIAFQQCNCIPGLASALTPLVLSHKAAVEHYLGDFDQAEITLAQSLNLKTNRLTRTDLAPAERLAFQLAIAADNHALGCFLDKRLAFDAAEKSYCLALQKLDEISPDSGDTVHELRGNFANVLGDFYQRRGQLEKAEALLQVAISVRSCRYKDSHPVISASFESLGKLELDKGNLIEARKLLNKAHKIRLRYCRENKADLADTMKSLSRLKQAEGAPEEEIEQLLRQALAFKENVFGPSYPEVADLLEPLAEFLHGTGCQAEAQIVADRALQIRTKFAPKK